MNNITGLLFVLVQVLFDLRIWSALYDAGLIGKH